MAALSTAPKGVEHPPRRKNGACGGPLSDLRDSLAQVEGLGEEGALFQSPEGARQRTVPPLQGLGEYGGFLPRPSTWARLSRPFGAGVLSGPRFLMKYP